MGGSPVFILGGLAVHEDDAYHLQQKLESFLQGRLSPPPLRLNALNFELHATDIKNGNREWRVVPKAKRFDVLYNAYTTLLNYGVRSATYPVAFFGCAVDRAKVGERRARERTAYELVLKKFDDMLGRINRDPANRQSGLVIHDQRVVNGGRREWTHERAIQEWTTDWRVAAGRIGRLKHFADIPLFADSRASRLIQAADLIAFAIWRRYGLATPDDRPLSRLLPQFDVIGEIMHGLIHVSRDYATGACACPPCHNRLSRGLDPAKP